MEKTFTRRELYNLVWSEPMRILAAKYEISDRGLAKACQRANIPVPERGYWNKLHAGKKVTRFPLPARGIGMSDEVMIGGNRWYNSQVDHEQALVMVIPPPPEFAESIESLAVRVKSMVSKVKIPKTMAKPHHLIATLLDKDETRRKAALASQWSWDKPIFATPFERRRLKILNSIFFGLNQCSMKVTVGGKEARELSVAVGDQWISFSLDSLKAARELEREKAGYSFTPRGDNDGMVLKINRGSDLSWSDSADSKIEDHIHEIVESIIVAGEATYRSGALYSHQWMIERKARAEKEDIELREKAERERIAYIKKLEKQRIADLLGQATSLRKAMDIRLYVKEAREINPTLNGSMPQEEFEDWANWALTQADRIDPIKSGEFRKRKTVLDAAEQSGADKNEVDESGLDMHYEPVQEKSWFQQMNSWPRNRG